MVKSGDGSSESSWGKRLWNLVPDGRYFRCPIVEMASPRVRQPRMIL